MILSQKQIEAISEILNNRVSFFVGSSFGEDYLTESELKELESMGFKTKELYKLHKDHLFLQYQLGMMSEVLGKYKTDKISFPELIDNVKRGKYIPLTEREKYSLDSIRRQSLKDIRSYKGRIFNDINNIVNDAESSNRKAYEAVIRKEIKQGVADRASYKEIAHNLGEKTGDWLRNWDRIVQFIGHASFDEGRAAIFERLGGEDQLVYKQVYPGACKHCIRLHLTNGVGSEPRLFKLSELKSNGNNIGRKTQDWKAVIGPVHPYCRCTLHKFEADQVWDQEKNQFVFPKDAKPEPKTKRPKVKVTIGDEEHLV